MPWPPHSRCPLYTRGEANAKRTMVAGMGHEGGVWGKRAKVNVKGCASLNSRGGCSYVVIGAL